jgi:hypothetical protein
MYKASVVKSIYFCGITNGKGELDVHIHREDAEISEGLWQFCLESCTIKLYETVAGKGATVHISSTLATMRQKTMAANASILPVKVRVLLLKGNAGDIVQVTLSGKKEWLSFKGASETSKLIFTKTHFDNEQVLNEEALPKLHVFGIMLIKREV